MIRSLINSLELQKINKAPFVIYFSSNADMTQQKIYQQ